MSMFKGISYVVWRGCLLWPVCYLGKTLLTFVLLHFVLQGQTSCYSRYLLTSYFCIPLPYDGKDIIFGVSFRRSCRSLYKLSTSCSSALVFVVLTWTTMMLNDLSWKQTKIILSFLRVHRSTAFRTLVDEGYSIPSNRFLARVVDTMVIWIKLSMPIHSNSLISKMSMFSLAVFCLTHLSYLDSWI